MAKSRSHKPADGAKGRSRPAGQPASGPGLLGAAPPAVRLPGGLAQRKIAVGPADDAYEREADAVADSVVAGRQAPAISRIPPSGLPAQRETAEGAEGVEEDEEVQALQREEADSEEEVETLQREEAPEEDEELQTLQREESPEEEEELQTLQREQEPEEEEVRALQREEAAEEDEEDIQTKPSRRSTGEEMSAAAERALREKGPGEPLQPGVRRTLESSLRADLGDVRVHRGPRAERAADAVNARAFAAGKDIWLGRGESPADAKLMGHEAAHVVHQGAARQRSVVQRAPGETTAGPGGGEYDPPVSTDDGTVEFASGTAVARRISIPKIALPSLANKDRPSPPFVAAPPGRTLTGQRDIWRNEIRDGAYDASIDSKLPADKGVPPDQNNPAAPRVYFLKTRNQGSYIIGTAEEIKELAKLPNWDPSGNRGLPLEVDHIHEAQLKGPNTLDNFQLLDRATNGLVGNEIRKEIKERIDKAAAQYVGDNRQWPGRAPSADSLRAQCEEIVFQGKESKSLSGAAKLWEVPDIRAGKQIDALELLTPAQVQAQNLLGSPTRLLLSVGESAGAPRAIRWGADGPVGFNANILGVTGFRATAISYTPGAGGSLSGEVFKNNKVVEGGTVDDLPITEIGGLPYTTRLDTAPLKTKVRSLLRAKGASPIEIDDAYIGGDSLSVRGVIKPSVKLFAEGTTIDIAIDGDDVSISKTFTAGEFDIPGPVSVKDSALTIGVGTAGLKVDGDVNFEVERVGKGKLSGQGDISGGFAVSGEFEFDKELFNEADAKLKIRYAQDKFSGEGTLKIGAGKVKGVKSASVAVTVDGEIWTAEGRVEPDVPGVKEGSLAVKFDPEKGLEITGRLEFGGDVPRLKSGHLEAKVTKSEEGWGVEGKGSAELDIPGAEAAVTAEYKNGLFKAEAKLGYEKGIAKGSVTAGVTNMPVGEDGPPAGEPGDTLSVYGRGSVTIRFTPWLEGTAGIKVSPEGKIEVTGKVALPDSIEVFPEKKIEKELLSVGVDIPIVGVAVAGQRIGIFLNISGSLTARAAVGPGKLQDVSVEVVYDPEDESSARITGSARFVVPADAGLKLGISGAIGAGIPVVSAKAGLEISGELGVKGEASASAVVEWTPETGIDMEANVAIEASPNFTFAITGFVDVTADLVLTEVELYKKTWDLASVEFGSGMTFGAKLPVKIEGGQLKDISLDDIEFTVPDVDPIDVAKGLIDRIK